MAGRALSRRLNDEQGDSERLGHALPLGFRSPRFRIAPEHRRAVRLVGGGVLREAVYGESKRDADEALCK